MSEEKWIKGQNGIVIPWFEAADMTLWELCNKDGLTATEALVKKEEEVIEETPIESLKEKAKELGIRGWNNAKEATLKKKIAEVEAEDGEEEGS
jgi:hypothetical protein